MRSTKKCLMTIAIGLLLVSTTAIADVGPMDKLLGGGAAAPKSPHESIRLDSQEVIIRLREDTYTVDVVFQLFNTGETITEWTGFPIQAHVRRLPHSNRAFVRFNTWANGREVKYSEEPDRSFPKNGKDRKWLVHQITFPAHAWTTIRVTYEAHYYTYHGLNYEAGSYVYGTGSYWKDKIRKAVFIIDAGYVGGTKNVQAFLPSKSQYRRISENLMRYELSDFKPDPEAKLKFRKIKKLAMSGVHKPITK